MDVPIAGSEGLVGITTFLLTVMYQISHIIPHITDLVPLIGTRKSISVIPRGTDAGTTWRSSLDPIAPRTQSDAAPVAQRKDLLVLRRLTFSR